jgi:uncharacterized protein (TIGR02246 family)
MKHILLILVLQFGVFLVAYSQDTTITKEHRKAITDLIDQYAQAREKNDTILLKDILTVDVDQLVSTGEWREGIRSAIEGMLRSSANSPGTRTLSVAKIQKLNASTAIVDCRYEIQNTDGSLRKMWSTFIVVADKKKWKIRSIRNMLPAANN